MAAAAATAAPPEIVVPAATPALIVAVPAPGAFFSFSSFSHWFLLLSFAPALSSLRHVPDCRRKL